MTEQIFANINNQIKQSISKDELDNIYSGVSIISNSFERLKIKLAVKPFNSKIIKICEDLKTLKQLLNQVYLRLKIKPPLNSDHIDAKDSKEFIKKLRLIISDTIFKCAAVCNSGNVNKSTDFALIIMVLADLNKDLI